MLTGWNEICYTVSALQCAENIPNGQTIACSRQLGTACQVNCNAGYHQSQPWPIQCMPGLVWNTSVDALCTGNISPNLSQFFIFCVGMKWMLMLVVYIVQCLRVALWEFLQMLASCQRASGMRCHRQHARWNVYLVITRWVATLCAPVNWTVNGLAVPFSVLVRTCLRL